MMLDEASLVYAVMEPVDANLGEVVSRQRLTVPETRQLAVSLVAVLEALHSHGFVHEHIEPANVLAVGEVVKLRCDCIREAPEGEEGLELKRRDLHDLAVVLLQALTQEQTLEAAARDLPLPAPFDQIVRKGMTGEWGVVEIVSALEQEAAPGDASRTVISSEAHTAAARTISPPNGALSESKMVSPSSGRIHVPVENEVQSAGPRAGRMLVIGPAVILLLWLGWYFVRSRSTSQRSALQETSTPAPTADSNAARPAAVSSPLETANASPVQNDHAAGVRNQWRVIAYTYNHEGQAQQKSGTLAQRHPELRPEVFTPDGHAPYLVTIGGTMSRDEAFALADKVRSEGLPGDTYAQNYSGKAP